MKAGAQLQRRTPMKRSAGFKPAEPKPAAGPKTRKCANRCCSGRYIPDPARKFKNWCSDDCALVIALDKIEKQKSKKQRQERAKDKAKLLDMKPLAYFLRKAEHACNAYIRARDEGQGCISCGRKDAEQWNAGHFISVGANGTLRYDEDNIHLQCARPCNKDKGGNIVEYRKALRVKIGDERLARLEGWHPPVKRTRAEAEAIEAHYKAKLRELKSIAHNQ